MLFLVLLASLVKIFGFIFLGLLQIFRILRVFRLLKIISQSGQGEDAIANFTITKGDIFFQSMFIFGTIFLVLFTFFSKYAIKATANHKLFLSTVIHMQSRKL